ncbi:MAG: hypothetical protein MUC68_01950 [Burkholderiaceae bacterium]|jgi:general secretion pathway protein C|nr:hypothetical protein [Burkholderiaceae bacterium]
MSSKLASSLIHLVMFAFVCAIAAYWGVRILTPQPTAAPPPLTAPPPREPDPVLAARMFGQVQQAAARTASNIQVNGLFAAGKDSSAVLVVDGKPARVFVLGQDVAPGTRLVEVTGDYAVVESAGGRMELRAPPRPAANLATGLPARAYVMEGNTLSAPSSSGGAAPVFTPASPSMPPSMQPSMPQSPPPGMAPGVPLRAPGVPADTVVPGQPPPPPQPGAPPQ